SPSRTRSWQPAIDLALLLILPVLLLTINHHWVFSDTRRIDPWVYFGYYLNLPNHLHAFGGTYYGTRLSTIIPGYLAYQLLPPLAANYILHLILDYASVLSLYMILSQTLSRRAGFLAATCMGCHFFFLQAIGWDYVDGFSIAYLL